MKKLLLLLGLGFGAGFLTTSCKDQFFDVNTDPNNPVSATPNILLPSIIAQGIQTQMFSSLRVPYITQYIVRRSPVSGNDQFYLTNANSTNTFNYSYFYSGGNIPLMEKAAQDEGSAYYVGAGKIMQALILSHATDMLGDIPFSQAYQGAANYTPKYDDQKDIYDSIYRLLDEGIAEMQKPASANLRALYSTSPSVSGDILFKGDVNKWIRLAYSLKARQMNHLTKKASYDPNAILALCDKGFTSTADDAQLQYQVAVAPLTNTTSIFGTTRSNFGSATFSTNIVKYLNGTTYAGVVDPRFPIIATAKSTGADPGVGVAKSTDNLNGGTTDFYSSWYARDIGYFEVITYHELKFIEAEAALRANKPARALAAYKEGIRAHMAKIGVGGSNAAPAVTFPVITPAQIADYLSSAAVAQNEGELTFRRIMEQKYIAMFLNPESWSDMRRFDFKKDIYVNLVYPKNANPVLAATQQFPRRLLPGNTEVLYNPQEVARIGGNDPNYILKPMWWDQP